MIRLSSHKSNRDAEFCQFRLEEIEETRLLSAGFFTLHPEDAAIIAHLIALGGQQAGIEVRFEETVYDDEKRKIVSTRHCVD